MSSEWHEAKVASPCVSICVIDPVSGLCAGCYRSLEEIAGWIDFSTATRRAISAELIQRRALHGAAIESRMGEAARGRHGER